MRPWDLDTSAAQLRSAMEDLQIAWQETSEFWQDGVSQKFCETHLQPLGPVLKRSLDAVGQMQSLVNQMRRELDDEFPGMNTKLISDA
ncbi:MAG: hypothetical protein KDA57_18810 [Planctomycetales bacterium]|nr:hypothetical protein [Planctomycetales bacterium]